MEITWLLVLANLVPTIEQVGAIPLGLSLGLDPISTLSISLLVNCMLFFPVFFGLELFYDSFLSRLKIFRKYLDGIRKRGKPYVDKYGVMGITLFISLPSPLTGTYTGAMLSWVLGMDWRKAFLAICLGSLIGGIIVLLSSLGILTLFGILF